MNSISYARGAMLKCKFNLKMDLNFNFHSYLHTGGCKIVTDLIYTFKTHTKKENVYKFEKILYRKVLAAHRELLKN